MAGITLAQAEAALATWVAAEAAIAAGQEYEIADSGMSRRLKRADLGLVGERIAYWDAKVKQLTPAGAGGRRRTRYIVPE